MSAAVILNEPKNVWALLLAFSWQQNRDVSLRST
jgi:hypothetical protein